MTFVNISEFKNTLFHFFSRRGNLVTAVFKLLLLSALAGPFSSAAEVAGLPPTPSDLISTAHEIDPDHIGASWAQILGQLQIKGNVHSTFTENRFFPFKKAPSVFTGEIRLSAEHGLSLHYLTPEDRRMTIDSHGVLLRDHAGHRRELPSDPRASAATAALLDVMRFDFGALGKHFRIYASGDAQDWFFGFEPKNDQIGQSLNRIVVSGQNDVVRQIIIRKSASSRVEITIGQVQAGVIFTPDELQRFFR